ncbi:MAG: hypothetical protein V4590_10340 [Bacteroidota bacterium]
MVSRLTIILLLSLCVSACTKTCPDPLPEVLFMIADTPSHWLEGRETTPIIYARSAKGLTESYDISSTRNTSFWVEENCARLHGEVRHQRYISSLYQHKFRFTVQREKERSVIMITDDSYYDLNNTVTYDISQNNFCEVIYYKYGSYQSKRISLPIATLDTLTVQGRLYNKVFRIDFDSAYSIGKRTKAIYFTAKHGLVRFDEFDGDSWDLY